MRVKRVVSERTGASFRSHGRFEAGKAGAYVQICGCGGDSSGRNGGKDKQNRVGIWSKGLVK